MDNKAIVVESFDEKLAPFSMNVLDQLRAIQPNESLSADTVFEAIFAAGSTFSEVDREDDIALEIAIRLLEARRTEQLPADCIEAVEMLAEECGLYPYVDKERFSLFTQSVIEAHAIQLDEMMYLHSKQMSILLYLLAGRECNSERAYELRQKCAR